MKNDRKTEYFRSVGDTIDSVQRKYKTEIGESMGKPDKKLKKMILIVGITGAVYGSFRYLLPLVIPFLFAYVFALLLRPSAAWAARRCRIRVKGRHYGIPVGVIGAVELTVLLVMLLAGLYFGGRKLCVEACLLLDHIPTWTRSLDRWLTGVCHDLETLLCLKANVLVILMREMLRGLMVSLRDAAMPYLMVNSMSLFRIGIQITVMSVVLLIAVALSLQEMDRWKERCRASVFQREFRLIARRLANVGDAYLKTQGIIMLLTTVICTTGFRLMGNPYYILAGVSIGILDALPVFGTGTVLIPWAVLLLFRHQWARGLILFALYLICYFLREILEAKMMGDRVGLSPLETLISMYVGLQLFGIPGFLLGPIGLLLIEDLVQLLERGPE